MKKLILGMITAFILFSVFPVQVKAETTPEPATATATPVTEAAEAQVLLSRLNEIKSMDLKGLNASDKKQLRHEVKAIKSQLKALTGGVYLSAAAIVIIILIVVLLL